MRVRPATAADVPAMMDLERQSPAAGHWSRNQYQALFVATNQKSERVAWVVEDDGAAQSEGVLPASPGILAFLIAHRVDATWELENLVVAATARRRGIGKRLLGELIEQSSIHAGQRNLSGSPPVQSRRALLISQGGLRGSGFTQELLLQPSRGCNPLPFKVLIGLSHNEIAPEFGIEPILVLW